MLFPTWRKASTPSALDETHFGPLRCGSALGTQRCALRVAAGLSSTHKREREIEWIRTRPIGPRKASQSRRLAFGRPTFHPTDCILPEVACPSCDLFIGWFYTHIWPTTGLVLYGMLSLNGEKEIQLMREEVIPHVGFLFDLEWKSCETHKLVAGLFVQIGSSFGMKLWGIKLPVGSFSETLWCISERVCFVLLELVITPCKSNINTRYQKWPYFWAGVHLFQSPSFFKFWISSH